jgi:hypothetical protein
MAWNIYTVKALYTKILNPVTSCLLWMEHSRYLTLELQR